MDREEIKKIVDEAIGSESSIVEATLEKNEYYIYTEVWTMPIEQFNQIRTKIKITSISVDGGRIMLTAKV
jgi:hypothetical protein